MTCDDETAEHTGRQRRFDELLRRASAELHEDNPELMDTGALIPTPNVIADDDLALFFEAVERGLVRLHRGGRFNTLDRPKPEGRWSLLSRSRQGGWYNAEYLPQIAAYAEAVSRLAYPAERVLFELPASALQLDLAILDDAQRVVVLGEAKRDVKMLAGLVTRIESDFAGEAPGPETKRRGDEGRQLAWRLWTTRAPYLWLIGPGYRPAYEVAYEPLRLTALDRLPAATRLGLDHSPGRPLPPPSLAGR